MVQGGEDKNRRRLQQNLAGNLIISIKFDNVVLPVDLTLADDAIVKIISDKIFAAAQLISPAVVLLSANIEIPLRPASPPPPSPPPPTETRTLLFNPTYSIFIPQCILNARTA